MIALRFEAAGNVYQICLDRQATTTPLLVVQVTIWLCACDGAELLDSFFNTACCLCWQDGFCGTVCWGCLLHLACRNVQRSPWFDSIGITLQSSVATRAFFENVFGFRAFASADGCGHLEGLGQYRNSSVQEAKTGAVVPGSPVEELLS